MRAVRDLKQVDGESRASLGCKTVPCNTNQSNVHVDNLKATYGFCVSCIPDMLWFVSLYNTTIHCKLALREVKFYLFSSISF